MSTTVLPFLMFTGQAKEAADFWVATIPGSSIEELELAPDGSGGVAKAVLSIAGQRVRLFDSPPVHDFTFTPSWSFFVEVDAADEVDRIYAALSEGGMTMMPLDAYPFSERFAWCADRFGVSWQISLASA